jgi:hypothetical protein
MSLTAYGSLPTVAGDAQGETVAAWYDERGNSTRVVVRVSLDGGRSWGPDQMLGGATSGDPGGAPTQVRAGVSADGKIAVVWPRRRGGNMAVMIAEAGSSGRFGASHVLSAPGLGGFDPDVAVAASGEAVVVWVTGRGFERALVRPGGKLASRRVVPQSAGAYEPTVAVDPRGDRVFAWILNGSACDACTFVARESAAGALTPPQSVSSTNPADSAELPQAALSRSRRATVVWEERYGGASAVIEASSAAWGSRFSAPQQLSPTGSEAILGGGGGGSRGVGVDASGRVSAVWVEVPVSGRGNSRVRVATTSAFGRFRAPRTLQHERGTLTYERPAIAVALGGRILATWTLFNQDPAGSQRGDGIWGAVGTSGTHGFSAPTKLSGPNGDQSAVVATSRAGAGVAVYSASESGLGKVDASQWAP